MRYCKKCLYPDTKPHLTFNEDGVCSACTNYDDRKNIDWDKRKQELRDILDKYKGNHYDCIIPVSGGKDSTYQTITILEMGYKPLCVTATTDDLTDIGRRNIDNIKNLGVDYVEFSINPKLRKKLNRIGLLTVGDISWPEHVAIYTIPFRMAVNYKVPLVIFGENGPNEYGGPATNAASPYVDRRWMEEFAGMNGMRVDDLIEDDILEKDMWAFTYPTQEELNANKVTSVFLGHFILWDGLQNAFISQNYGFETYQKIVEGSCVNYENLDNYQTGIHDYFMWLKFGYGRATPILSTFIRRGRITREQGFKIIKMNEGKYPSEYLGKPLEKIIEGIVTLDEFNQLCKKYKNEKIHEELYKNT
jgi:N-acetyl sugar amidotransferase